MTMPVKGKEIATRIFYADLIRKHFPISEQNANELAAKLIDQVVAHGGNPNNLQEAEKTALVVVSKWLEK